jgi:hypothetical protein
MKPTVTDAMVEAAIETWPRNGAGPREATNARDFMRAALEAALSRRPEGVKVTDAMVEAGARVLVPVWYGGFEDQRSVPGTRDWLVPPGTPNARARATSRAVIQAALSSLETEQGEKAEPVGYLFDLRYSDDNWSRQKMYSEQLPREGDYRNAIPLFASQPSDREGWKLVPVEPTREMWAAMADSLYGYKNRHHDKVAGDLYRAMLAAAPTPTATTMGEA